MLLALETPVPPLLYCALPGFLPACWERGSRMLHHQSELTGMQGCLRGRQEDSETWGKLRKGGWGEGEQMGGVTTCVGCLCGVSVTSILQNSGRSIKLATHLDHTESYSRYKIFSFWQVLNFTCHSIYFKMIKKQLLYHSHSTRYHVLWIPHPRSQVCKPDDLEAENFLWEKLELTGYINSTKCANITYKIYPIKCTHQVWNIQTCPLTDTFQILRSGFMFHC